MYTLLACIAMDDTFNKDKTDQIKYYGLVKTAFDTAVKNLLLDSSFKKRILVHFGGQFPSQLLDFISKRHGKPVTKAFNERVGKDSVLR